MGYEKTKITKAGNTYKSLQTFEEEKTVEGVLSCLNCQ